MRMLDRIRKAGALTAVLGLLLVAASPEDEVRLDPGEIAGYALDAYAAPVTIRVFEPTIPIPADPGFPNAELTIGFASARLGAGPVSRAVSSLVWPGPGVGDGFGNFAEEFGMDPESSYPLRAAAQFPTGPLTDSEQLPSGGGMHAEALGLDVLAETEFVGGPVPDLVSAGTLRALSTATVEDGVATAVADSAVSKLALLEGLITVDNVRTRLVATTDGVDSTVRGATDVGGLIVAGTRYAFDRDGVRIEEEDDDEDSPFAGVPPLPLRLLGVVDLSDLIGVKVEVAPVKDVEDEEVAVAGRRSEGVLITLDFSLLFEVLNLLPEDVVFDLLPSEFDDLRAALLPFLGLSPIIEIALGYGDVEVSASEAFDFGDLAPPPPPPAFPDGEASFEEPFDLGDGEFGVGDPSDLGDGFSGDLDPPMAAPDAGAQPPEAAVPFLQAGSAPERVSLAAQLLMLVGVLVALAAWGLDRMSGAALAAPGAAAVCRRGADGVVPDLRRWVG